MSFQVAHIANEKLNTNITGSKVESLVYNKTNLPTTFYTPDFFEPRDINNKVFFLNHANIGVFEQSLGFRNTLDVAITLSIKNLVNAGDGDKTGATLWTGTLPPDARFFFVTDRSETVVDTASNRIVGLFELRLPYLQFVIDIKAQAVPTTGQVMIQNVRRY